MLARAIGRLIGHRMQNDRRGYDLLENRSEHCQVTCVSLSMFAPFSPRSFVNAYVRCPHKNGFLVCRFPTTHTRKPEDGVSVRGAWEEVMFIAEAAPGVSRVEWICRADIGGTARALLLCCSYKHSRRPSHACVSRASVVLTGRVPAKLVTRSLIARVCETLLALEQFFPPPPAGPVLVTPAPPATATTACPPPGPGDPARLDTGHQPAT